MKLTVLFASTLVAVTGFGAHDAKAARIEAWNVSNVDVPLVNPPDDVPGFSVIYDRDATDPGAITNGAITFTPPEAVLPGIQVDNAAFDLGGPGPERAVGCLRTSNPNTTCDGDFQSGKRIKQLVNGLGPVDLVFDVDPDGAPDPTGDADVGYQVFHRIINNTGRAATGFTVSLGFNVGEDFVASVVNDGLGFSSTFVQGPNNAAASSQFPFGLFGNASTNPNFTLDGFYDNARSGFDVTRSEDTIQSGDFFGAYGGLFGNWLSRSEVPLGGLWDNDGDDSTDALVMAWFDEALGLWEVRREVDSMDPTMAVPLATPEFFADFADVESFLGVGLDEDVIEDLANLNVNMAIALDAGEVDFEQFTLRVELATVPLPLPAGMLIAGLGALGFFGRRRKS